MPGIRAISLGDVRAEQDKSMLASSFYESSDYRTLIESDQKAIVVGRRGTGKSALYIRLSKYFESSKTTEVVCIAADEHDILALRPLASEFGGKFDLIRAATRLAFRYSLLLEIASSLSTRFKFERSSTSAELSQLLPAWRSSGKGFFSKVRKLISEVTRGIEVPESRIAALADKFDLNVLESALSAALNEMNRSAVILIDRLDEGYEPDSSGVGIVDGFVQAAIDIRDRIDSCRTIVFLRDNIFRAMQQFDKDFSRNLEQSVLRLHWDERALLNLTANRIRTAGGLKIERSIRVWDWSTQGALQGESGFASCLRLTLFRPRDLLLLLNEAFRIAASHDRRQIEPLDIDRSAHAISTNRLSDLVKEYEAHLPGLHVLVSGFSNRDPAISAPEACEVISNIVSRDEYGSAAQQQFALFADAFEGLRALYSVGFVGIQDQVSKHYVFCHDGRRPDKDFNANSKFLIHPCYWMALNISRKEMVESEAEQIYDEYDVTVVSETPEQRSKAIGKLVAELGNIELGLSGWRDFEDWCLKVIRVLFATGLRNIERGPSSALVQRRDILGTNHGLSLFWKRALDHYGSKQILFEVKNFSDIGRDEFRQMISYLSKEYGRLGFIITRDDDINLRSDHELPWVREIRNEHDKVVVKLTAKYLVGLLGKIRSPAKHDVPDDALNSLLDTYVRSYFGEQIPSGKKRKRKSY